jgi:hypothetical protein
MDLSIDAQANEALAMGSLSEISNRVLEIIYQNSRFFGFSQLDEDNRSAFLLSLGRVLPHMLGGYDKTRKDLVPYLWTVVHMYLKSWTRTAAKQQAAEDSLEYCYQLETDDLIAAESAAPDYGVLCSALPKQTSKPLVRDMLLALGLKTCLSLSDRQISLIISITGIDSATMMGYISLAKESLKTRLGIQRDLIQRRNRAFYLKTKYRIELDRLSKDSSQYRIVEEKYTYQCRVLEGKNQILKERTDLRPTNVVIGEILGIPSRRITRLLELARNGRLEELLQKEALLVRETI